MSKLQLQQDLFLCFVFAMRSRCRRTMMSLSVVVFVVVVNRHVNVDACLSTSSERCQFSSLTRRSGYCCCCCWCVAQRLVGVATSQRLAVFGGGCRHSEWSARPATFLVAAATRRRRRLAGGAASVVGVKRRGWTTTGTGWSHAVVDHQRRLSSRTHRTVMHPHHQITRQLHRNTSGCWRPKHCHWRLNITRSTYCTRSWIRENSNCTERRYQHNKVTSIGRCTEAQTDTCYSARRWLVDFAVTSSFGRPIGAGHVAAARPTTAERKLVIH